MTQPNKFTQYSGRGLTGLVNMGNTCFVNSCLQVLSHTYELNDFLNEKKYKNHLVQKPESKLLIEWDTLRELMWSQNCIIEPGKFIQNMQRVAKEKKMDLFTDFSQNDASEFLIFIVDCFHISISRPVNMQIKGTAQTNTDSTAVKVYQMIKEKYSKDYSEIWNMFYGTHISQIISLTSPFEVLSQTPEPFFTISLPIPNNKVYPSIYDCFDNHVRGDHLTGDNGWFNEKTKKKQDVVKKISYWAFPNVLCIDIKRFDTLNKKKQTPVSFPLENLNLSKYTIGYKKDSYVYDLYGIINHHGNALGGHYTSYIKNANEQWYEFNDTRVIKMNDTNKLITPYAYCLFYRKKNSV